MKKVHVIGTTRIAFAPPKLRHSQMRYNLYLLLLCKMHDINWNAMAPNRRNSNYPAYLGPPDKGCASKGLVASAM